VIRVPEPAPVTSDAAEYEIQVRYDGEYSALFLDHHPCDVEGWKGDYFPFAFNIRDWNVIMSDSLHLPPSMHVFLVAEGVNIINLLPRPFETAAGVERIPWFHRNADYDEIALIHGGNSTRSAVGAGHGQPRPAGHPPRLPGPRADQGAAGMGRALPYRVGDHYGSKRPGH